MRLGRIPDTIYQRSVWKELKCKTNKMLNGADRGEDCAIFMPKDDRMTCMVSASGVFTDVGKRVVHMAVNKLAAKGTLPETVMVSALLPENAQEGDLKQLMRQVGETCQEFNLSIVAGPVTVVYGMKHPVLTLTGIGKVAQEKLYSAAEAKPGQDVVASKWIGLEGTWLLAKEKKEELLKRFSEEYIEEALKFDRYRSILPEAAVAAKSGAGAMYSVAEGGIFGALWRMADASGVGLEIELKKIPIRQETVEICNFLDINPYELFSMGSLLMTADHGYALVQSLQREGLEAAVIGKTTDSNDRLIVNEEEKRFLTPAKMDELYKILE